MKFITKMRIVNFESHEDTTIVFSDGLNAITGPSNAGKTAIFRALKWVLYNRPSGSGFVRRGAKSCSVEVWFSDGAYIKRYRKGASNFYDVRLSDGREWNELTGFGVKIPNEVLMAHGMRQIFLGDRKDSLNLSEQLSAPFLLSNTPQQRGMIIGKILRTEIIDRANKDTSKDERNINKEVDKLTENIENDSQQMEQFNYLDDLEKTIKIVEKDIQELKNDIELYDKVADINNKLEVLNNRAYRVQKDIDKYKPYFDVSGDFDDIYEQLIKVQKISEINDTMVDLKRKQKEYESIIEKYSDIDKYLDMLESLNNDFNKVSDVEDIFMQLKNHNKKLELNKAIVEKYKNINDIEKDFNQIQNDILFCRNIAMINESRKEYLARKIKGVSVMDKLKVDLDSDAKQYKDLIKSFGKCPVCFSEIDDKALDVAVKNLI